MAPRRNNSHPHPHPHHSTIGGGDNNVLGLSGLGSVLDQDHHHQLHHNGNGTNNNLDTSAKGTCNMLTHLNLTSEQLTRCCVPGMECFQATVAPDFGVIHMDNLSECVRVICNNDNCTAGQYMHRECFESWEQTVLNSLKTIGRARSWTERQRAQNLWTKKGYDLVYKVCGCKCSSGHLRKDLDWTPPTNNNNVFGRIDEEATKKKKKRNRNNQKPALAIATINPGAYHPNSQINHTNGSATTSEIVRARASSLSSSNGSSSPPVSSEHSISPVHHSNAMFTNGKHKSILQQMTPIQQYQLIQQQRNKEVEIYSERVRSTSGCNGIFSRRLDFSSFNLLPKTRLNSYQVKIEDEGNHGNDETRLFILSSLAQNQKSRVNCILCDETMFVFDRYPLVDGTFFLSPKQHSPGCIEVKYDQKTNYLTAVCMSCLDGNSNNRAIHCRFCHERWSGSSLILGTMYSYDIFAAMPCCVERLKCNQCFKLLLHPHHLLNFYSEYSQSLTCSCCQSHDTHFVKPLTYCYNKVGGKNGSILP